MGVGKFGGYQISGRNRGGDNIFEKYSWGVGNCGMDMLSEGTKRLSL